MFDELSKEIKAHLYDKAKGPLTATFLLSWFVVNFQSFVILFAKGDIGDKLLAFGLIHPTGWDVALKSFILPVFYTVLILLIYPHPARWAYEYWAKQHLKLKRIQVTLEDETPMTQEEANLIRRASLEQELKLQNRIDEISKSKKQLEDQVDYLNDAIKQLQDEIIKRNSPKVLSSDDFESLSEKNQKEILNMLLKKFPQEPAEAPNSKERKRISIIMDGSDIIYFVNNSKIPLPQSVTTEFKINTNIRGLEEAALFGLLVMMEGKLKTQVLIDALKTNRIITERALENLKTTGLLTSLGDETKITSKGREIAIRTGMVKISPESGY